MSRLRRHGAIAVFYLSAIAAGVAPLIGGKSDSGKHRAGERSPWPMHYEGVELREMPLSAREVVFLRGFPGRVGRFFAGGREIIIRQVDAPTRRLHSAADCLRGGGYAVKPLPSQKDASGHLMGCMRATLADESLEVCELIRDSNDSSWPDVSEWYWNALLDPESGPWWSYVVAREL